MPLVLCYLEGMSHDRAAATIGCPVGTVRSRLPRTVACSSTGLHVAG